MEKMDTKHFAYTPSKIPIASEDGDCEVLQQILKEEQRVAEEDKDSGNEVDALNSVVEEEEHVAVVAAIECEARDALSNILADVKMHVQGIDTPSQVSPLVEYSRKTKYKSTLVIS